MCKKREKTKKTGAKNDAKNAKYTENACFAHIKNPEKS